MDYAEVSFGQDLANLILNSGMTLIAEEKSDPVVYQQLRQNVSWINQPEDPVHIGSCYYQKRDLRWGLADFLVKQLVKEIPLPAIK